MAVAYALKTSFLMQMPYFAGIELCSSPFFPEFFCQPIGRKLWDRSLGGGYGSHSGQYWLLKLPMARLDSNFSGGLPSIWCLQISDVDFSVQTFCLADALQYHHQSSFLLPPFSLHRPIAGDNRGRKMLKKLGWKEGEGLGKESKGRADPVSADIGQCFCGPSHKAC